MKSTHWIVSVATVLCAASPVHAALLAHWAFDETSGTIASDSAGSLDGTLAGAAAFSPAAGISGGAISLNEVTNDFVNMGNVLNLGTQDFSLAAWIKTTKTTQQFAVAKHATNTNNGYMLAANVSAGYGTLNKAYFYVSSGDTNEAISSTTVNDGEWHHVVGVYDAGGAKHIYVDGTPAETSNAASAMVTNGVPFLVGGLSVLGTPTSFFTGLIDEVRVYDHTLSDAEVQQLFDCPSGTCPTTTLAPTTTTTLIDSSTSTTTTTVTTSTTLLPPGELCGPSPRTGCDTAGPGKGSMKITAKGGTKNKLKWKLAAGTEADAPDFGDPVGASPEFALCIYDSSASSQPVFQADLASGAGWKTAGAGFAYKNKAGNADGITKAKFVPGAEGKTMLQVLAKGTNLVPPTLPLTSPVTTQFVSRRGDQFHCWTTPFPAAKNNTADSYKAKTPGDL